MRKYEDNDLEYAKPCEYQYHLFSNGCDDYFYPDQVDDMLDMLENLLGQDVEDIRISKDTEWNSDDGIFEDGESVFSIGAYPI